RPDDQLGRQPVPVEHHVGASATRPAQDQDRGREDTLVRVHGSPSSPVASALVTARRVCEKVLGRGAGSLEEALRIRSGDAKENAKGKWRRVNRLRSGNTGWTPGVASGAAGRRSSWRPR